MSRRRLEERILVLMERTRGSVRTEMRSYPDDLRARYEELARWKPDDTAVSDERFDVRSLVSSVQRQLGGKWARLINDKDFSSANKVSRYLDSLRFEDDLVTPKPDAEKYAALHRRVNEYMSWLMDRIGSGQKSLPEITRDEIERWVKEMVVGTQKNMNRLARFVQAAVNRVEDWGGTRLVIVPAPDFDDPDSKDVSEPVETFLVEFQTGHRERAYNPYFMLFTSDGKFEHIDNVLHAGDPDFFKGGAGGDEHDYFRLVSEIRDPGSTSRKGRDVVIWTARPTKDRKLYQQATRIPAGIFVTNDPDRAWGIAYDLGGGEVRDLWRIVINSRYLHETLRAGRVRDYQVVGRGKVPVKEAKLWAKGKSRRR